MQALAERILSRTRKRGFRTRPLFQLFQAVDLHELDCIETKLRAQLPDDLRIWLLAAGYGDVDETLSFRHDWFYRLEQGCPCDAVIFAQDDLGNFYAYSSVDYSILFLERAERTYATIASSFGAFLSELERRDFGLRDWTESLTGAPYPTDA